MADWVFFEPSSMSALDQFDEVDEAARGILARETEVRLRGKLDPGADLKNAHRSQAVRVQSEGGRLVISSEDPGEVLQAAAESSRGGAADNEAAGIEGLFEMSSGIPSVRQGADGKTQLVFKTISMENLFGAQKQVQQDARVEETVTEVVRAGIVDAYDESIKETTRRYPQPK